MKSRLRQTPLPAVKFTLAGQQAFPQQAFGALQSQTLLEVLVICYQDVLYVIRMINHKSVQPAETEVGYVAVTAGQVLEENMWPTAIGENSRERKTSPGTRRACGRTQ